MDDKRALLASGAELRRAILEFNFRPALYLHPSRRVLYFPEIATSVWDNPRTCERLSAIILKDLKWPNPFIEVNYWGWNLALLSQNNLRRLARHISAVSLRHKVRASLAREHVLSWKQKLGLDAYKFAITSASLLPALGIDDAQFGEFSPDEMGYGVICAAISEMPEEMLKRMQLKLPDNCAQIYMDSVKARKIISTILYLSEGKWFSSHAVTY